MKKTSLSIAKAAMPLILMFLLCFEVFGQENQQEKSRIKSPETLFSGTSAQEEIPKPTPEAKKPTREPKVEQSEEPSTPQDAPNYSPEGYPAPQGYYSPRVDVNEEIDRVNKENEAERQKQNKEAQREAKRQQKAYDEQQRQNQELLLQRQRDRDDAAAEQRRQDEIKAGQQEEATQKAKSERMSWVWLILLFEAMQAVVLAVIAYRKETAKKSCVAMIIGLIGVALGVGFSVLGGSGFNADAILVILILMICFYAFFIGKTSTYIIVLLSQESLTSKLLSVFSVGLSLIAVYVFFNEKNIGINFYNTYGMVSGFCVIAGGGIFALVKNGQGKKEDLHGSARFAEKKEFKEFENPVENGAFILASAHPDGRHGKVALPRSLSLMHGLILGGSGTGKSRGFFMPNCAEVENTSLVVTDPKSELWKYTSGYHDKAMRYAPTEPEASQCFNWIPLCTDARMSELCARALMTAGSTGNTDQFWIDSETAFLSAIFAHTATTKYPTPLTAYRLFTRQKPEELMQQLLHSPSYVAREQAIVFEQTDAKIKGAIVPAIASRLQFMRDPSIQLFTSAQLEAPNFGQLRRTPTAVYWCLREQDIARLRPLTSLFFTVLLEQIAGEEVPEDETAIPITAMLDEFANIGKIPDFETTISLARGRGVALWLGVQSLSQFKQTYGEHAAQTIMSNCATKVALHGLDYQTAEYVSKMLGEQTISHSSSNFNIGLTGGSIGSSAGKHRRPLLTPDEVMRIDENEAIARTSNKYPMRLYKGYYNAPPKTYPVTPSLAKIYVEETEVVEDLAL